MLSFDEESQKLELYIECSKGTYIRSIANDLGERLGCYGHLVKLIRSKAGLFELGNTVKLDDLETAEQVQQKLIYPLDYLNYQKYELSESEKEKVSHGIAIPVSINDGVAILTHNSKLIAVVNISNKVAKMSKVFI